MVINNRILQVLFSADLRHLQDINSSDSKGDVKKELLSAQTKLPKAKSTSKLDSSNSMNAKAQRVPAKKSVSTSRLQEPKIEVKTEPEEAPLNAVTVTKSKRALKSSSRPKLPIAADDTTGLSARPKRNRKTWRKTRDHKQYLNLG